MNQTFEINNKQTKEYYIGKNKFIVINDFYKNPDNVVKYFSKIDDFWHKHSSGFFHQGIDFIDRRHYAFSFELKPIHEFLETITKKKHINVDDNYPKLGTSTNYTKFLNDKYLDYYFYPHTDNGITALVYLNKINSNGTNFYEPINFVQGEEHKEHFYTKNDVKVIHHIKSEYNKLIIWDGKNLLHGLCMDKKYINNWRLNQVFFFED